MINDFQESFWNSEQDTHVHKSLLDLCIFNGKIWYFWGESRKSTTLCTLYLIIGMYGLSTFV